MFDSIKKELAVIFDNSSDADLFRLKAQPEYVSKFVDEAVGYKAGLISLLSKHESWDPDDLRVVVDSTYTRELDTDGAELSLREAMFTLAESCRIYEADGTIVEETNTELRTVALRIHSWASRFCRPDNRIPDGLAERFRASTYSDARIKDGSKSTRTVRLLINQYGYESVDADTKRIVEKALAAYGDAMNPLKVERTTVLSVNPCDFLLMSKGYPGGPGSRRIDYSDRVWSSCHDINSGSGCYCEGCLSYAMDGTTMILFTVEKDTAREDITWARKITRQLYFWNDYALLPCRCYPANDCLTSPIYAENRAIVEHIISSALAVQDMWRKLPEAGEQVDWNWGQFARTDWGLEAFYLDAYRARGYRVGSLGGQYRDWEGNNYPAFTLSYPPADMVENLDFCIGSDKAFCLSCGGRITPDEDYEYHISCADCWQDDEVECAVCGCYHSRNEMRWDDQLNGYVCDYCWDERWVACPYCGQRFDSEYSGHYVDGVGYACEDCLGEHYDRCERCGDCHETEYMTYVEGYGYVCGYCLSRHFTECDSCHEYHFNDNVHHCANTGNVYCEDCIETYAVRCEDCGEWFEVEDPDAYEGYVCGECQLKSIDYRHYIKCPICGKYERIEDVVEVSGYKLCPDCIKNYTAICQYCKARHLNYSGAAALGLDPRTADIVEYATAVYRNLCRSCQKLDHVRCSGCDALLPRRSAMESVAGTYYCPTCVPKRGVCADCGRVFTRFAVRCQTPDGDVCIDCYNDRQMREE